MIIFICFSELVFWFVVFRLYLIILIDIFVKCLIVKNDVLIGLLFVVVFCLDLLLIVMLIVEFVIDCELDVELINLSWYFLFLFLI